MNLPFFKKKQKSRLHKTNCQVVSYSAIASSDVGAVRQNNEDKVFFIKPNEIALLESKGVLGIIADGMGGHNYGEVAAQIAVDTVSENYFNSPETTLKALRTAFISANAAMIKKAKEDPAFSGMGTTCTAVVLRGMDLSLAHVGDSRAYLVSKNSISKLTTDHTYVQHLLDHDVISQSQVQNHPQKNIVTKSLGPNDEVEPEIVHFPNILAEEDLIFLCTDGLYEYLTDIEIQEILLGNQHEKATEKLISTAKKRGGHDNISVLVITNDSRIKSKSKALSEEITNR